MSNGREEPERSEAVTDADRAGRAEPLDVWAGRIAEAVAPDEISFAGLTARVYAEGGRGRRGLLRSAPPAPGGAGGELATLLPTLWHALAVSYDLLVAALGSPVVSNAVSGAALLLALEERRASGARDGSSARAGGVPATGATGGAGGTGTADTAGTAGSGAGTPSGPGSGVSSADLAVLVGAVAQVSRCLQDGGTPRHRADLAAAEAVAALYEGRDAGAGAFLGLLAGHRPPGTPAPIPTSTAVSAVRRLRRRLATRLSGRSSGSGSGSGVPASGE